MNELADKVEHILGFNPLDMFGETWDTDWRVAGALMKQFGPAHHHPAHPYTTEARLISAFSLAVDKTYQGDSLSKAIIEACVEELGEK